MLFELSSSGGVRSIAGRILGDVELSDLATTVYGSVAGNRTTKEIVDLFVLAGWSSHRTSWTDCQVGNDFAEIEFYGPRGGTAPGFHGVVDPARADELVEQFAQLGVGCTIEFYDQDKNLVREHDVGGSA